MHEVSGRKAGGRDQGLAGNGGGRRFGVEGSDSVAVRKVSGSFAALRMTAKTNSQGHGKRQRQRGGQTALGFLGLEEGEEVGEGGELEQVLAGGRGVYGLVLENPGEVVGDEDGVEAGGESGVDVGAGTVTDHPGAGGLEAVMVAEAAVGEFVLFGQHLNGGEVTLETGAGELVGLLLEVAFGDQDAAVAAGEQGQGLGDAAEQLDLLLGDGVGEADDAGVLVRGERGVGELLEAADQGLAEALEAVAVGADGGVFDVIEVLADLFGAELTVVEVGDEAGDRALEVDVVFPQRVVGVEEEGLTDGHASDVAQYCRSGHEVSIGRRRIAGPKINFL
jgi:hypothetical protein